MTTHYTASGNVDKWDRSQAGYFVRVEDPRPNRVLCLAIQFLALVLIALALYALFGGLTVFEDGSWAIGHQFPYILKGCLPGALCSF